MLYWIESSLAPLSFSSQHQVPPTVFMNFLYSLPHHLHFTVCFLVSDPDCSSITFSNYFLQPEVSSFFLCSSWVQLPCGPCIAFLFQLQELHGLIVWLIMSHQTYLIKYYFLITFLHRVLECCSLSWVVAFTKSAHSCTWHLFLAHMSRSWFLFYFRLFTYDT